MIHNSYLNNITINMIIERPSLRMCSPKFFLMFDGAVYGGNKDLIVINQITVTGSNKICYGYHEAMATWLYNSNRLHIGLFNLQFYRMNQVAIGIVIRLASASLAFKSCTFAYIRRQMKVVEQVRS